jgi:hypothetical protein
MSLLRANSDANWVASVNFCSDNTVNEPNHQHWVQDAQDWFPNAFVKCAQQKQTRWTDMGNSRQ